MPNHIRVIILFSFLVMLINSAYVISVIETRTHRTGLATMCSIALVMGIVYVITWLKHAYIKKCGAHTVDTHPEPIDIQTVIMNGVIGCFIIACALYTAYVVYKITV